MATKCSTQPNSELKPSPKELERKAKVFEEVEAFYTEVQQRSGLLSTAQEIENSLIEDYITGVVGIANPVQLTKYNWVESQMAKLLGWKKWLWQNSQQFTEAGAVRQNLLSNANQARELIKVVALERSLPEIKTMWRKLKNSLPDLPAAEVEKLLHDQIVIGSYRKLLNVNPNELLNSFLQKRFYEFQQRARELGIPESTLDELAATSEKIMNTFDELRFAAANAGMDIDALANGGYFPLLAQKEFDRIQKLANEKAMNPGFRSITEDLQKTRKLGVPFALNEDRIVALFQPLLLKKQGLGDESLALLKQVELDNLAKEADVIKEKHVAFIDKRTAKLNKELTAENERILQQQEKALRQTEKVWQMREDAAIALEKEKLYNAGYKKPEVDAILLKTREDWIPKREEALQSVRDSFSNKTLSRMSSMQKKAAKDIREKLEQLEKASGKRTQAFLKFEEARFKLREMEFRPGEFSKMLSSNLSEGRLKRLFESGVLTQVPLVSHELENYFKSLDVGVEGLSDALRLDPVEAIKTYASELTKAVHDSQLMKTVLTTGYEEGWMQTYKVSEDYIMLGNSPALRKFLDAGKLGDEVSQMYIHRTAAEQLNALLEINSSPAWLANTASAWRSFTSFFGKSALLATGGLPYLQRVFTQNLPSIYAATGGGGIAQLPLALVDNLRVLNQGIDALDDTKKIYLGRTMTQKELYTQFRLKTGGGVLSGVQETYDALANPFAVFDRSAWKRMFQFNDAYFKKHGNPLTGKIQSFGEAVKELGVQGFAAAYAPLAFGNHFLDNTAKWATVRELASTGRFSSVDEILNELNQYFDLSSDPGVVGNFISRNAVPFASFAMNAPGAALRHAIHHPYRAINVGLLYAQGAPGLNFSEAELPPWLRESQQYALNLGKSPDSNSYFVLLPGGTDFYLDSAAWFGEIAKDLAGGYSNVTDYVENETDPSGKWGDRIQELLGKTYVGQAAVALLGIDPRTMEEVSDPDSQDTLLGAPMAKRWSVALRSAFPVLRALDKKLPASIVGQQASTRLDPLAGIQQDAPAKAGWAGVFPAVGGGGAAGERTATPPAAAQIVSALTGISLQEIDPNANLVKTYRDFDSRLGEIRRARNAHYRRMAQTPMSPQQKALADQRLEDLKRIEVVLMHNKQMIDELAARKGVLPPTIMEQVRSGLERYQNAPVSQDAEAELLRIYLGI